MMEDTSEDIEDEVDEEEMVVEDDENCWFKW